MPRNATGIVTTIGIEIGKNSLHLVGLEGCLGSRPDHQAAHLLGLLSEVKQTISVGKLTFAPGLPELRV